MKRTILILWVACALIAVTSACASVTRISYDSKMDEVEAYFLDNKPMFESIRTLLKNKGRDCGDFNIDYTGVTALFIQDKMEVALPLPMVTFTQEELAVITPFFAGNVNDDRLDQLGIEVDAYEVVFRLFQDQDNEVLITHKPDADQSAHRLYPAVSYHYIDDDWMIILAYGGATRSEVWIDVWEDE